MANFVYVYCAIILAGAVVAYHLLAPEMGLPIIDSSKLSLFRRRSPRLRVSPRIMSVLPKESAGAVDVDEFVMDKISRMEAMLIEKNKLVSRLQKEIDMERSSRVEFEKVKNIMEEEIVRLREQVKNLKQLEEITYLRAEVSNLKHVKEAMYA